MELCPYNLLGLVPNGKSQSCFNGKAGSFKLVCRKLLTIPWTILNYVGNTYPIALSLDSIYFFNCLEFILCRVAS